MASREPKTYLQQSISYLHVRLGQKQLHYLQILVVDRYLQWAASQQVGHIDVNRSLALEAANDGGLVPLFGRFEEFALCLRDALPFAEQLQRDVADARDERDIGADAIGRESGHRQVAGEMVVVMAIGRLSWSRQAVRVQLRCWRCRVHFDVKPDVKILSRSFLALKLGREKKVQKDQIQ